MPRFYIKFMGDIILLCQNGSSSIYIKKKGGGFLLLLLFINVLSTFIILTKKNYNPLI
jgi:hypothetical protein